MRITQRMSRAGLAAAAMLFAGAVQAQTTTPATDWKTTPRDWSATLAEDAKALHDIVLDSHPGVFDTRNPDFRPQLEAGLSEALHRAETTTDAGGWWWAMRGFVARFDDGHLQIALKDSGSGLATRWPGFLTVYRGDAQVVATRDEADPAVPPLGARLIDCDGTAADRLAEQRIGAFRGRWFLEAQRAQFGDWLFMNASNPWISEMTSCRFDVDGAPRAYALTWRPAEAADLSARRVKLSQRVSPEFGLRRLDDGGFWLSTPSFNGDPSSEAHKALTALIEEIGRREGELRAAPYVVLDLRGNGGGSSHWSREIAVSLWGPDWIRAHNLPPIEAIEWRASEANLAAIQALADEWTAAGESAERIRWARDIIDGMTAARAEGLPYWRDAAGGVPVQADAAPPPSLVHGPIFVLTDPGCGSACLDAVDIWKAAGAIQIGRETSADTVYMDVREAGLASGLATLVIPMKVWRGRQRGNNAPQRPAHLFDGDMRDDAALQAWVRTLVAGR